MFISGLSVNHMSMTCWCMAEDLSELQFSVLNCPQQHQKGGGKVWVGVVFPVNLGAERTRMY